MGLATTPLVLMLIPTHTITHYMYAHATQVIAASALIIAEARQLLEVAEPAWDYAAYDRCVCS